MSPHIALIGTGFTSLTIARRLLLHRPALSFSLTIIDKARNPGGRLTSRTYPKAKLSPEVEAVGSDEAVTLETGARVFQSTTSGFHAELETFAGDGWVREVSSTSTRGTSETDGFPTGTRWWESVGGVSTGLIQRMVEQIEQEGENNDRAQVRWKYNTTVLPSSDLASALGLKTEIPVDSSSEEDFGPIDFLIHTAPSPQIDVLLPMIAPISKTDYLQTFCLLLPTIKAPATFSVYNRNPSKRLSAIATGLDSASSSSIGLVIQATPQQLGLSYEREKSSDAEIRSAFMRVLQEEGQSLEIGSALIDSIEAAVGSDSAGKIAQVKRWKFAQVSAPPAEQDAEQPGCGEILADERQFKSIAIGNEQNKGEAHLIIAGDGQSKKGGVEGAWESGRDVADWLIQRLGGRQ